MAGNTNISTLFLDIGGVLLTNGWDRQAGAELWKHLIWITMN